MPNGTDHDFTDWWHAGEERAGMREEYDRTTGGEEDNDQAYASISWRF
jgi:hypothetical protein